MRAVVGPGLVAAAVLAVYGGTLGYPFHYDDIHSIVDNPHIRSLAGWPAFFWRPDFFSADPGGAMFRPLVVLSYALQHAVHEYRVEGFRLFNLLVHGANAGWVYLLGRAWGTRVPQAAAGAALFALHPVHSETVVYISSRSESLAAFFALAACWALLRGGRWRWLAPPAYAAGLLCKSILIGLPALVWLHARRRAGRGVLTALALLAFAYLAFMQGQVGRAMFDIPVRPLAVQWATQMKALVYYAKLLVFPWGLSVDPGFTESGPGDAAFWAAAALVGSLVGVVCLVYGRRGAEALAWIAVFLGPTLAVPLNVLVNEHRLYLVSVPFCLFAAARLERGQGAGAGRSAAWTGYWPAWGCVVLLALLGARRAEAWGTPAKLWGAALEQAPYMPRPYLYLADEFKKEGRYPEALNQYKKALAVNPNRLTGVDARTAYNNLGSTYLAMGRFVEAVEAYRSCLAVDPGYERARQALEALLAVQGQEWDPQAEAAHKRGLGLLVAGRLPEAIQAFRAALERQVRPETYLSLALVYERREDWVRALQAYRILLQAGGRFATTAEKRIAALQSKERE